MHGLSAAALLNVWERGLPRTPAERAYALLRAALPETSAGVLASWTVGQRDAALLTLRERTFGPDLEARAACPACAAPLEMKFRVADLRVQAASEEPREHWLRRDGQEVQFRVPTLADLHAASESRDPIQARRHLLNACVLKALRDGVEVPVELLQDEVVQQVEERMAQADPQADVRLDLSCPACGHGWQSTFDIGTFFWSEINAKAQRLLHDVHRLAREYGWSEADILALSPARRHLYLEMAGS